MQLSEIASIRLHSQQIAQSAHNTPSELVRWMGAMQAQDFAMVQWALGVRLPTANVQLVKEAIDSGEIIRTHVMRPTWHLVTAEDIYWMLELTSPQIKSTMNSSNRQLGLTKEVVNKGYNLITETLSQQGHTTREELVPKLMQVGIERSNNRHAHLFMLAELDGLICSGKTNGNKQTYALLEERVPEKKLLSRDEALAELASRYFTSHCPATLQDFVWWSGLYVKDAKRAIEMIAKDLSTETINEQTYWTHNSFKESISIEDTVHLLPSFDEFIISYKDRSASISSVHHSKAISNNGIFWPIITVNGQIKGTWKRTIQKDKVRIETSLFQKEAKATKDLISEKAIAFGHFIGKQADIVHT